MDYQAIMSMLLRHRTYEEISTSVGCSRRDIATVKKAIGVHGITAQSFASMSTKDFEQFFPDRRKNISSEYADPHFAQVVEEMKRNRFFRLQQGWVNYVAGSSQLKKYSYSQYCALFNQYVRTNDLVATLQHQPGKALFVDWAGPTLSVVDMVTGEVFKAYFFVASLPYSGLVFCQAFADMKQQSWNRAHVNALEFIGGVTQLIVPDNAPTASHRAGRQDREVVITRSYRQLAEHYGTAILPARANKPTDKAHVEKMVQTVETRILGYLGKETWTSFEELNEAVSERLVDINENLRRVDRSTRRELFEAEEAGALQPLPAQRYEDVEYKQLKVGRNYHVMSDYQYYSVPYMLAGKTLSARITATRVSLFDGNELVCEHPRKHGRRGQYSTELSHAPKQHQDIHGLWSRQWFLDNARSHGPATVKVITQVLDRNEIEAQAYLACRNILTELGRRKKVTLEAACQELLKINGFASYSSLKRVMATLAAAKDEPATTGPAAQNTKNQEPAQGLLGAFVRDAEHYKGRGQR